MVRELIKAAEVYATMQKPVAVIKWTASWCPPCKMIAPVYSQLAQKFPQVETVEVDVDKVQDAARMNGITAMPTFQFYVNGQLADSLQGADRRTLENLMAKYAAKADELQQPSKVPERLPPTDLSFEELKALSVSELKKMMNERHLAPRGFLEKDDFVNALLRDAKRA